MRIGRTLALLAIAGAGLAGCRGDRSDSSPRQFLPDMDDSPKWEPQGGSFFFAAGPGPDAAEEHGAPPPLERMMRQPVAGSVPFGALPMVASAAQFDPALRDDLVAERTGYLRPDGVTYFGMAEDGVYVDRIPVDVTRGLLERGEERFNIYCAACHGYAGDGDGMVGRRWGVPVANFHDPKYSDLSQQTGKDGYLFHIARYGLKNPDGSLRMPGYRHALDAQDAWAVVAYIRALQAAGVGNPPPAPPAGEEGPQ